MTALLIKKTGMNMAYEMMRNEAVDFPVLSAAAAEDGAGNTRIADRRKAVQSRAW